MESSLYSQANPDVNLEAKDFDEILKQLPEDQAREVLLSINNFKAKANAMFDRPLRWFGPSSYLEVLLKLRMYDIAKQNEIGTNMAKKSNVKDVMETVR